MSSGYAPNLDDPSLDYVMVNVSSLEEQFDVQFATVKVFNTLGQLIYSGDAASMPTDEWKPGIYLMRFTSPEGKQRTEKVLKSL